MRAAAAVNSRDPQGGNSLLSLVLDFQAQLKVALIHEISLKLNIKAACASFPR
jgi:hypothetical protein